MLCTHCSKFFGVNDVKNQRESGFNAQIQCPHCDAWLGKSPILSRLKMLGFYLGIVALTYGYFTPEMRNITTPVAIIATMLMLVSHMMDHLKVIEAPEKVEVDDSEQRQKYR
ncbi:hypothetical protein HWQ46_08180 [Shewanella sp. D64]|uniref:hypothetical protein n=1 Tax=unclassified Shewanella TaxID=196818 RepID=UPI0022BA6A07|nr:MULTISPECIES: hypothetical protein [unclassified Shewanella]MEC4725521.1 hypothetical protein [Shewanella sp. D64]MEC4738660.1 hypothetical protein [Shewanella sp. E94]WBJ94958.1 hypothetical protein HWQ47_24515 [Shewanella sp. MTB7]